MKTRHVQQALFPMTANGGGHHSWTVVLTMDTDNPENLTVSILWGSNLDASHWVDIPLADLQQFIKDNSK